LLLLLGGGGAWNYHRNLARESHEDRPLRGYAEADLQKLLGAYEQEATQAARRAGATRRATPRDTQGQLVGQSVHEFERVQRASRRVREANGDVAEVEMMVERIKQELSFRDQERDPTAIFMRRLTSLDF
jgi:multidrug resistance efflux pump